jgi:tetratricopeptide (TPR) repeat protein
MRKQFDGIIQEARSARTRGQSTEARRGYGNAAVLARDAGDNALLAFALRHISELYLEDGSSDAALAAGNEAVSILDADPAMQPLDLANALRVTALALEALARPAEAVARWQKARELYAALDVQEGVTECDRYLGRPL